VDESVCWICFHSLYVSSRTVWYTRWHQCRYSLQTTLEDYKVWRETVFREQWVRLVAIFAETAEHMSVPGNKSNRMVRCIPKRHCVFPMPSFFHP
jgi:hypothetical protein